MATKLLSLPPEVLAKIITCEPPHRQLEFRLLHRSIDICLKVHIACEALETLVDSWSPRQTSTPPTPNIMLPAMSFSTPMFRSFHRLDRFFAALNPPVPTTSVLQLLQRALGTRKTAAWPKSHIGQLLQRWVNVANADYRFSRSKLYGLGKSGTTLNIPTVEAFAIPTQFNGLMPSEEALLVYYYNNATCLFVARTDDVGGATRVPSRLQAAPAAAIHLLRPFQLWELEFETGQLEPPSTDVATVDPTQSTAIGNRMQLIHGKKLDTQWTPETELVDHIVLLEVFEAATWTQLRHVVKRDPVDVTVIQSADSNRTPALLDNIPWTGVVDITNVTLDMLDSCMRHMRIKTIRLPYELRKVSDCFTNCKMLSWIDLEHCSNLMIMGPHCFRGCSSLVRVLLPPGIHSVGHSVFEECVSLTDLDLDRLVLVRNIPSRFMYGCSSMRRIRLAPAVTHIQEAAFSNMARLASVDFGGPASQLVQISTLVFEECVALEQIVFPPKLESIGPICCKCTNLQLLNFESCVALASVAPQLKRNGNSATVVLPASKAHLARCFLRGNVQIGASRVE